jgi:hypothetical protein
MEAMRNCCVPSPNANSYWQNNLQCDACRRIIMGSIDGIRTCAPVLQAEGNQPLMRRVLCDFNE